MPMLIGIVVDNILANNFVVAYVPLIVEITSLRIPVDLRRIPLYGVCQVVGLKGGLRPGLDPAHVATPVLDLGMPEPDLAGERKLSHVRHDLIDRILSLERYCLVFCQHGCYYCKSVGSSNHFIHME